MSIICDVSTVLHLGAFLLKQNKQTDILILQEIEFFLCLIELQLAILLLENSISS